MSKGDRKVSRKDLKGFDREATALILWAQERGARVRVTKNGHAVVYAPDGESTTTVPPNFKAVNRGGKNAESSVRRLFK